MRIRIALTVLTVLFMSTGAVAEEPRHTLWSPQFAVDVAQPGYNRAGTSRQLHLTLAGVDVSLLRAGRFRFPTAGLDFQVRFNEERSEYETYYHKLGFFLLSSGVKVIIDDGKDARGYDNGEIGIHIKGQYATRVDPDPRVGRWGVAAGVYLTF